MPHASAPDDPGHGPPATGSAFRVLLVHMPFADIKRPAIGLSLLKAGLARAGVECDVLYLNLLFAQLIGRESYAGIDRFNPEPQLGEWLFAEALFPGALPELSEYYAEVLRPALAEPFDEDGAAFARAVQEPELLAGLVTLRRQALEFVEEALVTHPWQRYALVGFSTTFQQNLAALALARRVKEAHPRVLVAFGERTAKETWASPCSASFRSSTWCARVRETTRSPRSRRGCATVAGGWTSTDCSSAWIR